MGGAQSSKGKAPLIGEIFGYDLRKGKAPCTGEEAIYGDGNTVMSERTEFGSNAHPRPGDDDYGLMMAIKAFIGEFLASNYTESQMRRNDAINIDLDDDEGVVSQWEVMVLSGNYASDRAGPSAAGPSTKVP